MGDKPRGVRFELKCKLEKYEVIKRDLLKQITNTVTSRNLGQSIQSGGNFVVLTQTVEIRFILYHVNIKIQSKRSRRFEDDDMIVLWNRRDNQSNCMFMVLYMVV